MSDTIITIDNLSKAYRIGAHEEAAETLAQAAWRTICSPWRNFRRLRRLDVGSRRRREDRANCRTSMEADDQDIFWALRDVSFQVLQGEVVGIIGRNGAGKSTLLKLLSRITQPTSGRAVIRGRVCSLLEVGTGFHAELTGRENVYMNGTVLGMTKREIDRKFDEIVEFSGVEKFLDTPIKRYSSGMQVRLAFAVAAHLEPEILIIDEVLAVGDAEFQRKCLGKMQDVAQGGRTVLFVSHNMPAVRALTRRSVCLAQGKLVGVGPTEEILEQYLASALQLASQSADINLDPYRQFRSADAPARFTRIWTGRHDSAVIMPSIDFAEKVVLNFEIESQVDIRSPYLIVSLLREQDQRVATLVSTDAPFHFSLCRGRQTITCEISGVPWSPGRYTLNAKIATSPTVKAFDSIVDFPAFEVRIDSPSLSRLEWHTRPWGAIHIEDGVSWSMRSVN